MSQLQAKRAAILTHVAKEAGFVDLTTLRPEDREMLEQRTEAAIEGFDPQATEPSDPGAGRLHSLLRDYRELRADEHNVRLAERGEVFAPEDDA